MALRRCWVEENRSRGEFTDDGEVMVDYTLLRIAYFQTHLFLSSELLKSINWNEDVSNVFVHWYYCVTITERVRNSPKKCSLPVTSTSRYWKCHLYRDMRQIFVSFRFVCVFFSITCFFPTFLHGDFIIVTNINPLYWHPPK